MWHDKFLLNDNVRLMKANFKIEKESMVSVFVNEHTWSDLQVSVYFVNGSGSTLMNPIASSNLFFQSASIYKIPSGSYYVQLNYYPSSFEACSYFSMGMAIQPTDEVLEDLSQACNSLQPELPPKQISSVVQSEGYFTAKNIADNTNTTTHLFSYAMEFTVSQPDSFFDASLSYNSLASLFTLALYRKNTENNYWERMFAGQWDAVNEETSYLGLTQQIEYTPGVGKPCCLFFLIVVLFLIFF